MAGEKTVDDVTFRIRHTMMLVRDLDRSIDFYTRLLGMDVQRLRPNPEKSERVGYLGYVALYVSDLYKLSEKLKAAGVKFTLGPEPNRPGSKDHVAFIEDPDGYTIELTERHSKSGPPVKVS